MSFYGPNNKFVKTIRELFQNNNLQSENSIPYIKYIIDTKISFDPKILNFYSNLFDIKSLAESGKLVLLQIYKKINPIVPARDSLEFYLYVINCNYIYNYIIEKCKNTEIIFIDKNIRSIVKLGFLLDYNLKHSELEEEMDRNTRVSRLYLDALQTIYIPIKEQTISELKTQADINERQKLIDSYRLYQATGCNMKISSKLISHEHFIMIKMFNKLQRFCVNKLTGIDEVKIIPDENVTSTESPAAQANLDAYIEAVAFAKRKFDKSTFDKLAENLPEELVKKLTHVVAKGVVTTISGTAAGLTVGTAVTAVGGPVAGILAGKAAAKLAGKASGMAYDKISGNVPNAIDTVGATVITKAQDGVQQFTANPLATLKHIFESTRSSSSPVSFSGININMVSGMTSA